MYPNEVETLCQSLFPNHGFFARSNGNFDLTPTIGREHISIEPSQSVFMLSFGNAVYRYDGTTKKWSDGNGGQVSMSGSSAKSVEILANLILPPPAPMPVVAASAPAAPEQAKSKGKATV